MEGVLVSAGTGALKAVTLKLATLLGDKFKHMKDVRKEIEPLSKELDLMHNFLERMSGEQDPGDDQDKIWMTDVREMSYDIEDSLDDFTIYLGDDGSAKPKGLIKKCRKLLNKMKAHHRLSKAIQDFKTQINEARDRNNRYRNGAISTGRDTNEMIDSRALFIFNDVSQLVGIDESKNELISILTKDESSSPHQLKVVSVVGCGGLGKTTLAKQVYDSLKDKFDCQAFVTVSRNPDMMRVLRLILSDLSGQDYTNTEAGDIQHLVGKISNFLQDKRYFIVVDDLWDSKSWDKIKCAFIKNSCGSRIITTTRKNEVAEYCVSLNQGRIYTQRSLSAFNSKMLLFKRIFGSEKDCPSHLAKVSDDILKKCGGLPLAIISIAGLLAKKALTFDEWNRVQSSFGYTLEKQLDISKVLSLSYFDLPPHLRSCLLYLSVFPEDHEIEKDRLILRWIAEGFIHEECGFTQYESQYESGERCLNELINRNLIETYSFKTSGTLVSCRVHDIILDFIVGKAMEENFITLFGIPNTMCDPRRKIRRLSLQDTNEIDGALVGSRKKMTYDHARAISIFTGSLDSLPSLQKFRHVRVLDLEGYEGLQDHHLTHLGGLFSLRYLGLRGTRIHKLPEEIGELQHLQTLDVTYNFDLKELPSSIVRLPRLVNLLGNFHVGYSTPMEPGLQLPDGFGNMQALQRLLEISLWHQPLGFADELRQLRNLRMLSISVGEFTEDLVSSLSALGAGSLNSLIVSPGQSSMNLMMKPWSPIPLSLKLLEIWSIQLPSVPRWIGSLENLRYLSLNLKYLGPADVSLLGYLNALSRLNLRVETAVADRLSSSEEMQLVKIDGTHGFPSLRDLGIGWYDCCLGLLFEAGAMPKLQQLSIHFDKNKTRSLTGGEFDFGIQHLPCLDVVTYELGFDSGEESDNEDWEPRYDPAWDALKAAVSSHPNHPRLRWLS